MTEWDDWTGGDYQVAIDRHAHTVGRPHPAPTNPTGGLSPRFVEWMMMLPEGWVTDLIPTKTAALKALGNGVVPPQAAHALRKLMERSTAHIGSPTTPPDPEPLWQE